MRNGFGRNRDKGEEEGMWRIDEKTKRKVIELYRPPLKLSPRRIGEQLVISRWTVRNILIRNNETRRSLSEACMEYPKTDFSGIPEEQARIVAFSDDCWTRLNGKQFPVETGTTHFPQRKLFEDHFGRYGHVGMYPNYLKRHSYYQWHVYVYLNRTFEFIIEYKRNPLKFLRTSISEDDTIYTYVGSLTDAEGSVFI